LSWLVLAWLGLAWLGLALVSSCLVLSSFVLFWCAIVNINVIYNKRVAGDLVMQVLKQLCPACAVFLPSSIEALVSIFLIWSPAL
jgi:hypothetical protein